MRKLFVILILMVSVSSVYASAQANLVLKAYKVRVGEESSTLLFVTDAVTTDDKQYETNLGYLGNGRDLDITSMVDELVGNINSSASIPVFSYRVESNQALNCMLEIKFDGPFKTGDEESGIESVGFRADLMNTSGQYDAAQWSVTRDDTNIISKVTIENTQGVLKNNWNMTKVEGFTVYNPWIARGAVGIVIDSVGYSNLTKFGRFSTTVTVTLTTDGG